MSSELLHRNALRAPRTPEIKPALADSKMKARLADLGGTVLPGAPADFGKLIVAEVEKWAEVVKFSGQSRTDLQGAKPLGVERGPPREHRRGYLRESLTLRLATVDEAEIFCS
jgi:hypothetical protein